jgi:phage terminase large subunit-like protein
MLPKLSLPKSLASLDAPVREKFLASLDTSERALLAFVWPAWARPSQLPPPGSWRYWLFLAGRGAGKTRAGAEWVRKLVEEEGVMRIALVAPTAADARDVMVLGESGIVAICPPWNRPLYEPSKRRLVWPNGAQAFLYSAEEPDRLRGPQHEAAWCDELCSWTKQEETWDMLQFGLRVGINPRAFISTTPRLQPLLKALLTMPECAITRATTFDNASNLAQPFIEQIAARYKGTRLGRKELEGELLEDIEGTLWTRAMIEKTRTNVHPISAKRIVVGLDPSGGGGSAQGIVVAGLGGDGLFYVLEDASCALSPERWADRVASVFDQHRADKIVLERNFGGDLGLAVLQRKRRDLPVQMVTASRGKHVRAEPIALLYEQGKVRHVGAFPELEDQLCAMRPDGYAGAGSPDRLDALVWALTELSGPPKIAFILGGGRPYAGP